MNGKELKENAARDTVMLCGFRS